MSSSMGLSSFFTAERKGFVHSGKFSSAPYFLARMAVMSMDMFAS
jgi:hypothetical protein